MDDRENRLQEEPQAVEAVGQAPSSAEETALGTEAVAGKAETAELAAAGQVESTAGQVEPQAVEAVGQAPSSAEETAQGTEAVAGKAETVELAAASQTQQSQLQPGQVNPYAQPQAPAQTYPQPGQVNPYVQPQVPVQAYPQQGAQQPNAYTPQAYAQAAKRRPAWFWPVVIGAPIAGILLLVLILWACGVFGGSAGASNNPKQLVENTVNAVMKGELGKLIDVVDPVDLKEEKDSLKDLRQQLASAEKFLKPLLGTFLREAKVQIKDFRPSDKEALRRPENGEEYDFNGVIQFRNFKNPLTGESMDQELDFNVELVYRNGLWYFSADGFQNFMSKAFSPIN